MTKRLGDRYSLFNDAHGVHQAGDTRIKGFYERKYDAQSRRYRTT